MTLGVLFRTLVAQADIVVDCNRQAFITSPPSNVISCGTLSPTLTAKFAGAFGQIIPPMGDGILFTYNHTVFWRRDGVPIPGSTNVFIPSPPDAEQTTTLTLTNATAALSGLYDVVILTQCNRYTSTVARVAIGPVITNQPLSVTGNVAQAVNLSVGVIAPTSVTYQWRLDGSNLVNGASVSGAQSAQLNLSPLHYWQEGNYDVVITDFCGASTTTTSSLATVTILPGPQWVRRTTNGPSARSDHAMAYDSARRVTVLFGGFNNDVTRLGLSDLWEWNGWRWNQRITNSELVGWTTNGFGGWIPSYTGQPVKRYNHAMAYDSKRGRTVMFGGWVQTPNDTTLYLRDTWEWDGDQWYFRGTNGPPQRYQHRMIYDARRGVTVMAGGLPLSGPVGPWEWDGNQWRDATPTNANSFTYYQSGSMAYDSFRGEMLFGPYPENLNGFLTDFVSWNGTNWSFRAKAPDFVPILGAMAFDDYRRRAIYFAGGALSFPSDWTWSYHQTNVMRLTNFITTPSPRTRVPMAYDGNRHTMLTMGGLIANLAGYFPTTNDTWELQAVDRPLINEPPASQFRLAGETASFSVTAVGPGTLSYQWLRDGLPLVNGGRISGATATNLLINNVNNGDAATYSVRVTNACGATYSVPAILTLTLKLQIFSSGNTATLVWAAPNVVLETATQLSGPWTEVVGATSPFNVGIYPPNRYFRLRQVP